MLLAMHLVLFSALVVASYHDIRTREVPDWLSYAVIAGGFFQAILVQQVAESLIGFGAMAVLGSLLYYTGQWGGGDAKLLMGVGAVFGVVVPFTTVPVLGWFVLFLFVGGALYGMTWSVVLFVLHWRRVLVYTRGQMKIVALFLGLIPLIAVLPVPHKLLVLTLVGLVVGLVALLVVLKAVEQTCFVKWVAPKELTEGDWVAEEIRHQGKVVCRPRETGLSKEQVRVLQQLGKKVKVKYGIPFVPSFLIAYLAVLGQLTYVAF